MTQSAPAPSVRRAVRGRSGSAAQKRRRARAAFHAAARLVEACLQMPALPRPGEERLRGRAIACHVAREAFRIPIFEIAIAAGVDRRTASASQFRLWDRRDADPDMETRIEQMIQTLKAMAEDHRLARDALIAARTAAALRTRKVQQRSAA